MTEYSLGKKIGSGPFGSVYEVSDPTICVKEIDLRFSGLTQTEAEREVQFWMDIDFPLVVKVHSFYTAKSFFYIVMEKAEQSLLSLIKSKEKFSESFLTEILYQLLLLLKFFQENSIVHSNIKPSNILITQNHNIKISDFGIAKASREKLKSLGRGPINYLSPLFLTDGTLSSITDVWSVGCIMYELMTLNKMFDHYNEKKLVSKILFETYNPLTCNYSSQLIKIVNSMLVSGSSDVFPFDYTLQDSIFSAVDKIHLIKTIEIPILGHEGIINFLRLEKKSNVSVRSISVFKEHRPENLFVYDSSVFSTARNNHAWVMFSFANHQVSVSEYHIMNTNESSGWIKNHLMSWIIEGSNDSLAWENIHSVTNSSEFSPPDYEHTFKCTTSPFYSYIRLRQTSNSRNKTNSLAFCFIEFGGRILVANSNEKCLDRDGVPQASKCI